MRVGVRERLYVTWNVKERKKERYPVENGVGGSGDLHEDLLRNSEHRRVLLQRKYKDRRGLCSVKHTRLSSREKRVERISWYRRGGGQ